MGLKETRKGHGTPNGQMPNAPALTLLQLQRCKTVTELKQFHASTITSGLHRFAFVTSKLLAFSALSPNGDIYHAEALFNGIRTPNLFDFNTMITGFSKNSLPQLGISLFAKMRARGVGPNHRTFSGLVQCCVCLDWLGQVHGQAEKFGQLLDAHVSSRLVTAYSKCERVELARRVFDECMCKNVVCWTSMVSGYGWNGRVSEARELFDLMPDRNEVSCSAMISGYVQNGYFSEAIELFREWRGCGDVRFKGSLLVGVLNACAAVGALEEGKWVHRYVDFNGCGGEVEIGTALINFYAKCGCIDDALEVFRNMEHKDVMAWSAVILGLSINGEDDMALNLFVEMLKAGFRPNGVTLLAVLTSCNHKILVSEAWWLFGRMVKVHGISPTIEHYGCMVDLLARAGQVTEAERLMNIMPMKPDGAIWCSLLNGCLLHGHSKLGAKVGRVLIQLEPQHSGWYILLSNMFAAWGSWEDVISLRKVMKNKGVVTAAGWSSIEVDGSVHKFLASDKSLIFARDIPEVLDQISKQLDLYFLDND